jgi:hypothetical protein
VLVLSLSEHVSDMAVVSMVGSHTLLFSHIVTLSPRVTVVPPYSLEIHSKTPSGCMKLEVMPNHSLTF